MASKMSRTQMILLADTLKETCMVVDGFAVYKPGWDDEAVLKAVTEKDTSGRPYVLNHVGGLRRELYGNFRRTVDTVGSDVARRVDELEQLVQSLMAWKAEVEKRFGPVTTGLGRPGRPHSTPPVE